MQIITIPNPDPVKKLVNNKFSYIPQETYIQIVANIRTREARVNRINEELQYLSEKFYEIIPIVINERFRICQEINYLKSLLEEKNEI